MPSDLPTAHIDATTKAAVLNEALPYIRQFRGSIFVVKYGGSFMDDPDETLRLRVAADLTFLASVGIHVVVVHGGGKAISRAMEAANIEVEFRNGLRYTSKEAVKIVEKTLNEDVNAEICKMIASHGGQAVGIAGSSVLKCKKLCKDRSGNAIDLGYVGEIDDVDTSDIQKHLGSTVIPVVSPTAEGPDGEIYNTNADLAAAQVAKALGCRRLVFLCDVPGLMEDPSDPSSLISSLPVDKVDGLIADGIIGTGMLPKVDGATLAIKSGVKRVHFVEGPMPHSLLLEIFTDQGIGTEIVNPT
jgi:acetylglutamate kinase